MSSSAKSEPKKSATKPAAAMTPNGLPLRGSAGPRILKDLGLTDAELAAFLPADAPRWVRGVFWCQFEGPASLDAIAAWFAERFAVRHGVAVKFPPGAPEEGFEMPSVILQPKGKYVTYEFYGMRGATYVEDGSWQLEVTFRESGTDWGSNRAIYERFKALELGPLGAVSVMELTE